MPQPEHSIAGFKAYLRKKPSMRLLGLSYDQSTTLLGPILSHPRFLGHKCLVGMRGLLCFDLGILCHHPYLPMVTELPLSTRHREAPLGLIGSPSTVTKVAGLHHSAHTMHNLRIPSLGPTAVPNTYSSTITRITHHQQATKI